MCFGDMMQLRPVRGNYIFTRPKTEGFAAVYDLASRWQMFNIVNLEINHRQEGCKTYADLLNRMRTSNHTEDDIKELEKRVFKKGHPIFKKVGTYVVCTNKVAMEINDKFLIKEEGEEFMVYAVTAHKIQVIILELHIFYMVQDKYMMTFCSGSEYPQAAACC